MAAILKARVARWVACVVVVGACVAGVCAPTHAVGTPVPTPSVPVTTAPETPLLPNHGIVARVVVEQLLVETSEDTREWAMRISIAFTHTFDSPEKITREECQSIANTFWSGSAEGYFVKVSHVGGNCDIEAYYLGEARHAFYSLDEAGHVQVRAPMTYLTQIVDSFEDASITELQVEFTSINNAHCNAEPWIAHLDDPLPAGHWSYCRWMTNKGDTVPTTDEPLLEGDVEQAFFDFERGTVGPFIDMPAPINPFTITPTQADEPASGTSADAPSEASSASSRGLLIAVGAGAALLLRPPRWESPGRGAAQANTPTSGGRTHQGCGPPPSLNQPPLTSQHQHHEQSA